MVVIELILCAIPYEEGCFWANSMGMCWLCSGSSVYRADCFVLAGVVRCMLLFLSLFIGAVGLSVVSVGEVSCGSTGCLSCQGKQSTSLLLLLSSSGRSLSILS